MIPALVATLTLAAGWTIGYRMRPFTLHATGCPCADEAAFLTQERARFDDLIAQLDIPSDLDDGDSPFGWLDDTPKDSA